MEIKDVLQAGLHFISEPIHVPDGTHVTAEPGCRLIGGVRLKASPFQDNLWVCDLNGTGLTLSPFQSRGYSRHIVPSHSELFIDGLPMNISRYPKNDFSIISGVGVKANDVWGDEVGELSGGFYYEDPTPKTWAEDQDIWVHGYWNRDWAPSREKIETWDKEKGFIGTAEPYGAMWFRKGQRFFFFNVMEQVTDPGDYCLDIAHQKIYFVPREGFDPERSEILLSAMKEPAFVFDNAHDISLRGFIIEDFCGYAITVKNSSSITLENLTIRHIGNRAINVDDSTDIHLYNSEICLIGDGGIAIYCGDRATLTPGNCSVEGCHIHQTSQWDRCYEPPIRLYGVGLAARNNLIHDCPHAGILFGGNDIEITGNEIHHVVTETGDAGIIYGGRNLTFRGNVVSGNFLHHVGSQVGLGAMGIYNDDMLCGTTMNNNVFYKVQNAIYMGGGVDYVAEGNVFVDCNPAACIDGRGQNEHKMMRDSVNIGLRKDFYNIDGKGVSAAEPPYSTRYPELLKLHELYQKGGIVTIPPAYAFRNNIFCSKEKIVRAWSTEGGNFVEENNRDVTREELKDYVTPYQYEVICEG